ncbi:hypothetical protein Q7C36_005778 [Tachysurus vachellii]|uniref:Uncharacterized protein n=1 Tax=Tachysurus vachellii TaxID=175792 RepID=A0AA88NIE1_TACVA|nr:hypothetical protein Q7C36_005778 [Tachysurus vachellii]
MELQGNEKGVLADQGGASPEGDLVDSQLSPCYLRKTMTLNRGATETALHEASDITSSAKPESGDKTTPAQLKVCAKVSTGKPDADNVAFPAKPEAF